MNRNLRIVVLALVAVFVGCGVLVVIGTYIAGKAASHLVREGEKAAALADEIAEIELPDGYEAVFGMEIRGTKMVTFEGSGQTEESIAMWLLESPEDVDSFEALAAAMASMTGSGPVDTSEFEETSKRQLMVRGSPADLTVREGPAAVGGGLRQLQLEFEGKSGPALLLVVGPVQSWDQEEIDNLVESIR